ncbi:MAG TPA: M23 family metallopeptidase [Thermoanaerobaculia bacterium]|nr:M23 family metallopeptidase [Thermoanaerobaculia bacterium]
MPTLLRYRLLGFLLGLAVLIVAAAAILAQLDPALRHPLVALRLIRSASPSSLPIPVRAVRRPELRDTWGAARSGGRGHQGIDIFAPRGREILSATRGIVITVGASTLGGKIVRVLGPGGHWHYYAHLEKFADVQPGDVIPEGRVLGYVGDSGNANGTPPHLHYGIYRFRGGAINPYPLLRR